MRMYTSASTEVSCRICAPELHGHLGGRVHFGGIVKKSIFFLTQRMRRWRISMAAPGARRKWWVFPLTFLCILIHPAAHHQIKSQIPLRALCSALQLAVMHLCEQPVVSYTFIHLHYLNSVCMLFNWCFMEHQVCILNVAAGNKLSPALYRRVPLEAGHLPSTNHHFYWEWWWWQQ